MSSFGDGFGNFSNNRMGGGGGGRRGFREDEIDEKVNKVISEKESALAERDLALEDLRNVETAFSELHKRYERAKTVMDNLKQNEELLKARDAQLVNKVEMKDQQLVKLREEVTQKLEQMYSDYEKKAQSIEAENTRLRAQIRKSEMKISTLESDLEQKTKENAQLHVLCDDLINGSSGGGGGGTGRLS
ncbi:transforming acidic coiled-coil-containing protein 3 [Folsomia candida]|uniref:Transforming acidic coiled-coil-containing protein 3 n=1 Tax=Folsomia candida TaxID=158441 RepID=A0A226DN08_FOLCA|nr:transforming acidic coiled-coil-containing protein 3 [Folsomia candida]XP_035712571.1 transforming acidic coiled-coil-containing protein 3 [Folsomia candida]OXA46922.1 Transforming acidic coiled-coil-containing protein 3 [Folsomia candida]